MRETARGWMTLLIAFVVIVLALIVGSADHTDGPVCPTSDPACEEVTEP